MAVSIALTTLIAATAVGTPGTSTTTASVSNIAGALLLLSVSTGDTGGLPGTPTSISGLGLAWASVNSATVGNLRCTVFWAQGAASTGTLTITWAGAGATDSAIYQLDQLVGVDPISPVAQSNTSASATATPTVTLTSVPSATSATYGAVSQNSTANTATAGTNFTKTGDITQGTPSQHLVPEWNNNGSATTTVNYTFTGGNFNSPTVGLEVRAAPEQWNAVMM